MARMTAAEWKKKKKETQMGAEGASTTATTSPVSATSSDIPSVRMTPSEWREKNESTSLRGWARSAAGFLQEIRNNASKWHSEDEYNARYEKSTKLLGLADTWRKQYSGNQEAISYIDSVVDAISSAKSVAFDSHQFFSQFKDEEDYKFWDTHSTVEKRQAWYKEQQEKVEDLDSYYNNYHTIGLQYQDYITNPGAYTPEEAQDIIAKYEKHNAYKQKYGSLSDVKAEIEAIELEMRKYERADYNENGRFYGSKRADDHYAVTQRPDFAITSAKRDYKNPTREQLRDYDANKLNAESKINSYDGEHFYDAAGNIVEYDNDPDVQDKLGLFLSATPEELTEANNNLGSPSGERDTWAKIMQEGDQGSWEYLKPDEIGIYYTYLGESQERAYRYLEDMKVELNRRETFKGIKDLQTAYDDANFLGKLGLNALTVPAKLISTVAGTVDNAVNTLQGKEINPYSAAHSGMHYSQTVWDATVEDLDEMTGGWNVPVLDKVGVDISLGDLYQVGMSRLDSALATSLFRGGGTVLLGLGAAQEEAYRLYRQGASPEQITLGAFSAGAAEAVFEYIGFDSLVKIKDVKTIGKLIKYALAQGGVEALEETGTELTNIITNAVIMGQQSDLSALLEENNGDWSKVGLNLLQQATEAAFGGFLGGFGAGVTAGGKSYAVSKANEIAQNAEVGKTIRGAEGGVKALGDLALQVAGTTEGKVSRNLRRQAEKLSEKTSNAKVGKLYNAVQSANKTASTAANQADISKSLQRKGFSEGEANDIASAIVAQYNGKSLTNAQEKLLDSVKNNADVRKVISDIVENPQSTVGQRQQNIRDFQEDVRVGVISRSFGVSTEEAKKIVSAMFGEDTTAQAEAVNEDSAEVSMEGKSFVKSTGEVAQTVTVENISGKGNVTLTVNGKGGVPMGDVSFGDKATDFAFNTVTKATGMTPEAANVILSRPNATDIRFIEDALRAFQSGIQNDKLALSRLDPNAISKGDAERLFNLGRKAVEAKSKAAEDAVYNTYQRAKGILQKSGKKPVGKLRIAEGVDVEGFDEVQRTSADLAAKIAPSLHIDIVLYEDENPQKFGYYKASEDAVYLNVNARWSGNSMMTFTLAHELVHRAKTGSPRKFKAFADFLVSEYGKAGVSVEDLVAEQLAAAKAAKVKLTEEEAFEEVICDAAQRMLTDTDAGKKLAAWGRQSKENNDFLQKLKQWLTELFDNLRVYFKDADNDSKSANAFRKLDENVQQILADLFVDMSTDAAEKLGTIKAAGMLDKINTTGEGGVRYSLGITEADIQAVQNIGRISVNQFSSADIKATERFAQQYWKEMGVKSPFFRAWFGDWRANDQTKVQVATQRGDTRGVQKNTDTGWDIQVSGKVFNETKVHTKPYNIAARAYLPYINDIVQNAVLLDSSGVDIGRSKSNNSLLMHSLYAVADIGNGPEIIKLFVEEMNNPIAEDTGKRAYQLQNIEKYQLTGKSSQNTASSRSPVTAGTIRTVADLFAAVKQKDSSFQPKPVSGVVNADGTPKVVYHGSYSNFTIFNGNHRKHSKSPSGTHFFTDDIDVGYSYTGYKQTTKLTPGSYQGGIYPVYLDIKNPLIVDFDGHSWADKIDGRDVNEWASFAKANGFDGLIVNNIIDEGGQGDVNWDENIPRKPATDYVVFSSEQIKSATDNIGTFDGSNPDIRYKVSARTAENDFDYSQLNWARDAGIITGKDVAIFERTINNEIYRGGKPQTANGEYIIDTGRCLMFTDGDFHNPTLSRVIVFATEYESLTADAKEMIRDDAAATGDIQKSLTSIKNMFEPGFIVEHTPAIYGANGWQNRGGKGATGTGSNKGYRAKSLRERLAEEGLSHLLDDDASDNKLSIGASRKMLVDAFEGMAQSPEERRLVDTYRNYLVTASGIQSQLQAVRKEIRQKVNSKALKTEIDSLRSQAESLQAELDANDSALLSLEAAKPLRDLMDRAIKKETQKLETQRKELAEQYRESRKSAVDGRQKTEIRKKIRKVIRDLDKILNRGDKKRNVKEGMKDFVAEALSAAEVLFTDNYSNEDMIRNGFGVELTEEETRYLTEAQEILKEISALPSGSYDAWQARQEAEEKLNGKLAYRMSKLKDAFFRERQRLNKAEVAEVLGNLADAYAKLETSEYSYVNGAYHESVYQYLKMLQEDVGGAKVKDMTLGQLGELLKAYTMVLTTVQNANKMFAQDLRMNKEELAKLVMAEVRKAGGEHGLWSKTELVRNQASWNNTKAIYAAERTGSPTFVKLVNGLFRGQYNWALDMEAAKAFRQKIADKYGFRSWDMEKTYKFTSTSGIEFELNLNQMMSLYAYAKREQAHDHLLKGGFVFGKNTEVVVTKNGIKRTYLNKSAKAHNISDEIMGEIVGQLSKEQRGFVDEMQEYLSTTMGNKGNEISIKLYGVKLFTEEFYFPLRSAGQFKEKAKEAELKQQQGHISIANSGFTKAITPKASNPVVLDGFTDVWASHVNEMSLYHSMVLPMEDFRRVYNYASLNVEGEESESVNSYIENAYGDAATGYFDQLYKELNGGAVVDPMENLSKQMIGKFKKSSVLLSNSVWVQQFSAIGRAWALIDPKYFIGQKVDKQRQAAVWEEVKRYAPVAIIKEMGGFDTHTGLGAKDYLLAEEYGKGERIKGLVNDAQYRNELMGLLPTKADELTWCAIWEAVKRETKAKNSEMDVKSEEFLRKAAERFSEVIEKTQVYDSVLSRSANMRSKNAMMQMLTAFMAEPTTTVNMVEDALRKGDKKQIARTLGAVAASIVLNNALASIIYAMRDDDEEETFLEKYAQALTSGMLDDLNPMTYYPILKDIWSLFQGYDVERSDMAIYSDLSDSVKKLVTQISKFDSGMDEESAVEYYKGIGDALLQLLDAGASAFGVPLRNVRRDLMSYFNTIKTFTKGDSTTWGSFVDAVGGAALDNIPIAGLIAGESKTDKLYDAIINGDTKYADRLKVGYKDQNAINAAIRKGLRENDSRIREAAFAWNANDLDEYMRIAKEIIGEKHFVQDDVVMAIRAEASALAPDGETSTVSKAKGMFTAESFAVAISQGDTAMAKTIKADIIQTAQKNGKSAEEAEKSFRSSATSELKNLFLSGEVSAIQAVSALKAYCGKTEDDAMADVQYWDFKQKHPDVYADDQWFDTYYEKVADSGLSIDAYMDYRNKVTSITGDGKKDRRMSVIDSLPISNSQKDALYLAEGWAESRIYEAPWH